MIWKGRGRMADLPIRIDPVPAEAFAFTGGNMALALLEKRYSLRGEVAALQAFTAVPLPSKIGDVSERGAELAVMLGPDEWLLLGTIIGDGSGQAVSITEITERQITITLKGARAAEILMSGCPLDLERMAIGRGTRTIYETVEIVVMKRGVEQFHIEVWRSFAPWLWAALVVAAG